MKKLLVLLGILALVFTMFGCDTTNDATKEIDIYCESHYINTTESWSVNTRNGYKAIKATKEYDEDEDIYTVTLTFGKVYKGGGTDE